MGTKGLCVDTLETINLLKDNLRDRYTSGFPILKELIQNADDGGASAFQVYRSDGLPGARNPLLKGPAVAFINNGGFRATDNASIRRLGASHRAAEAGAIGKFGLGLKSVFHLCEAFFFMTSGITDEPGGRVLDIVNPWSGLPGHDWDLLADTDAHLIESSLSVMLGVLRTWFVLWLPLRQRVDGDQAEYIVNCFPLADRGALDFLAPGPLAQTLPETLPMPKTLERVSVWSGSPPVETFLVQLIDGSTRSRRQKSAPEPSSFNGGSESNGRVTQYVGLETLSLDESFSLLQDSPAWPRQLVQDGQQIKMQKDKNGPHAAVYLVRSPQHQQPALKIQEAVYLPLAKHENVPLEGEYVYSLILHGCRFIDAGRRQVLQDDQVWEKLMPVPQEETALMKAWNASVWHKAILPLILPVLERFVNTLGPSDAEVASITRAIAESGLFKRHSDSIGREYVWIDRLTREGHIWCLTEAHRPLWELCTSAPYEIISRTFPALCDMLETYRMVLADRPRLARKDSFRDWQEGMSNQLFLSISPEAFLDPNCVDCIREVLTYTRTDCQSQGHRTILGQVRQALTRYGVTLLSKAAGDAVRDLVAVLDPRLRWCLEVELKTDIDVLFRALLGAEATVLPLPKSLEPRTSPSQGKPSPADVRQWLRALGGASSRLGNEALERVCITLLRTLDSADLPGVIAQVTDQPLILLYDIHRRQSVRVSVDQTKLLNQSGLLFRAGKEDSDKLMRLLADVLEGPSVCRIGSEIAGLVLPENSVPRCSPEHCASTLRKEPFLRDSPAARLDLVQHLLREVNRNPCRYLLHGQPNHFESDKCLFARSEDALLTEVVHEILSERGETWRLVSKDFDEGLSKSDCLALNLLSASPEAIDQLLSESPVVKLSHLSRETRIDLLQRLESPRTLRLLPLHQDTTGRWVAIDENTFILGESLLPASLRNQVTVIKPWTDDPALARKQSYVVPALGPSDLARLLLQTSTPAQYAVELLQVLSSLTPEALRSVSGILDTAWLPLGDGGACAPEDMISLAQCDHLLHSLLQAQEYRFIPDLEAKFSKDPNFKIMEALFPPTDEAIARLVRLAGSQSDLHIGNVDIEATPRDLASVLAYAGEVLPVAPLLGGLLQHYPIHVERFLQALRHELPVERHLALLKWLAARHKEADDREIKDRLLEVHSAYLKLLQFADDVAQCLDNLELLNQQHHWKKSSQLCHGVSNIAPHHVLGASHAEALAFYLAGWESTHEPLEDTSDELQQHPTEWIEIRRYFDHWLDHNVPQHCIGGFLALFNDPKAEEMAQVLLMGRIMKNIRDQLGWKELIPQHVHKGFRATGRPPRWHVRLVSAKSCRVRSLTGRILEADISSDPDHLVVGDIETRTSAELVDVGLNLLRHVPNQGGQKLMVDLLVRTTEHLLARLFWDESERKSALETKKVPTAFGTLERGAQFDLAVAQRTIIRNFYQYHQGGRVAGTRLASLVREWKRLQRREAERLEYDGARLDPRFEQQFRKEQMQLDENLKEVLEGDAKVHKALLDTLREKIGRHYQYCPHSIPFELFANADDAYVESELLHADQQAAADFYVSVDDPHLFMAHWGRLINEYLSDGFKDGESRGFNRDLEKMLILHDSDKDPGGGQEHLVTGKFGLGFKTVTLASSVIPVISGHLGFEVVGGIYPRRLSPEDLVSYQERFPKQPSRGTMICLRHESEETFSNWTNGILGPFRSCLSLLLAFSRRIKRVCIVENKASQEWRWSEVPVPGISGLHIGTLTTRGAASFQTERWLLFRDGCLTMVASLSETGLAPVHEDTPGLWVTAPLGQISGARFVINGDFDVDIGRRQLAYDSPRNLSIADRLVEAVAQALSGLYHRDWNRVTQTLGLSGTCTPYAFWDSVWQVVSGGPARGRLEGPVPVIDRLQRLIMGQIGVIGSTIPTDLPAGPYRILTSLRDIVWFTEGLTDICLPTFLEEAGIFAGQIVSHACHQTLRTMRMIGDRNAPRALQLIDCLERLLGRRGNKVDASVAGVLGGYLSQLSDKVNHHPGHDRAWKEVRDWLHRRPLFSPRQGPAMPAGKLLADDCPETLLRFAPLDRQLHPDYSGVAYRFYELCRGDSSLPIPEEIAQWCLAASGESAQEAALRYLASTDGLLVSDRLRGHIFGTWIEDALESPDIMGRLSSAELSRLQVLRPAKSPMPVSPIHLNPGRDFRAIHAWWQREHLSYRALYADMVYPGGIVPQLKPDPQTPQERKAWLTLLIVGSCLSLGMYSHAHHRNFVQLCQEKGWMELFAEKAQAAYGREWLEAWEAFLCAPDSDHKYYYWMRQMPVIYQLSRWLEDYVDMFYQSGKLGHVAGMGRPQEMAFLQGGGSSAPPLHHCLKIGMPFVIRELARQEFFIHRQSVVPSCYVPSNRCLRIYRALSGQTVTPTSLGIYRFLTTWLTDDQALFLGDFDVPFWILEDNEDLLPEVLGDTTADLVQEALADKDEEEPFLGES